jgi:uncharacterized protein
VRSLAAVAGGLVFAIMGGVTALAQGSMSQLPPQIVVSGTGEARATPDRATLFLGVQSRATSASAAAADNARRQRAIIDTLRALGLASEQITTVNYNVHPEMQYSPSGGTPRVTAYVVSNSVRAEVRRLEDISRIIDAALAKGANEISSLQFYSSKADSLRRVAMAAAVADARADAEALARAAGGSLGLLLELSTSELPQVRPMMVQARMAEAASAARTPIEAGQQVITAVVTARWSFLAGR